MRRWGGGATWLAGSPADPVPRIGGLPNPGPGSGPTAALREAGSAAAAHRSPPYPAEVRRRRETPQAARSDGAAPAAAATSASNSTRWRGWPDQSLGVPLHAEHEAWPGSLDGLDRAVGGVRDRAEAAPRPVDGLVVEGIDAQGPRAHESGELRAVLDVHRVGSRGGRLGLAVRGHVLVQRPAARDVERLHAAADAQHRHPALVDGAGQRELEGVEVGLGRAELEVALDRSVGIGVEVRTAGQHDAVEPVEQTPRRRRAAAAPPGSRPRLRPPAGRSSPGPSRRAAGSP